MSRLRERQLPIRIMDTALNELIATGEIASRSANSEEVEELIAFIKAKLAAGELETEEDIRKAIAEGEQRFGVSLDESEIRQIVDFMMKIKKLGLDPNVLLDQAADLYEQFGDELLTKASDEGFWKSIWGFFLERDRVVVEQLYNRCVKYNDKIKMQAKKNDEEVFNHSIFPEVFKKVAQECYMEQNESIFQII